MGILLPPDDGLHLWQVENLIDEHDDLRLGQFFEDGSDGFHLSADDAKVMGSLFPASLLDILDLVGVAISSVLGLDSFSFGLSLFGVKLG